MLESFSDIEKEGNFDDIVNFLFGEDFASVSEMYEDIYTAAQDPSNKRAVDAYKKLKKFDSNGDGVLDEKDGPNFLALIKKGLGSLGFEDALAGDAKFTLGDEIQENMGSVNPGEMGASVAFMELIQKGMDSLKGKKLDFNALSSPDLAKYRDKIFSMPKAWKRVWWTVLPVVATRTPMQP